MAVAFHRVLVRIIGAEATTFFDPTTNIVAFGDSFVDGAIDIEDLERLPPRIGAGMLAHALDESLGAPLPRDARIVAYPMRHVLAVHTAERAVVGGLRLETGIRVDPPWVSDLTPDPNSRSTLWIPYLMDDGTLEVVLVQREGHRVVGSSIRHFSSLQSYLLAAPARMLR